MVAGAVVVLVMAFVALTRPPSEVCPPELEDYTDPDGQPSGVVCESPLIGAWQLVGLEVEGEFMDIPSSDDWGEFGGWISEVYGDSVDTPLGDIRGGFAGWVEFRVDGSMSGRFCNTFGTNFQVSADTLRTGEMISTARGCAGQRGEVERVVQTAFRYTKATFSILPGRTLQLISGETTMTFVSFGY